VQELKPKILVIDDEKALREGIKDFIESESFYVEVADNGLSGIELALKNAFDIIMIDMKFLKKLKNLNPIQFVLFPLHLQVLKQLSVQ